MKIKITGRPFVFARIASERKRTGRQDLFGEGRREKRVRRGVLEMVFKKRSGRRNS